ncbi:malignant fibrous histiocytoma-amplified sequence 1 homolog [Branchiostoma floridae]|uniref:non-specific serine/threonine protein kinase n=1 Tax=Branchiostoma floridae TaxID=7739 RepID=A0A9J7M2L7_BRAFL|nr:malignant fibrous histiocytoma-amplified sequence 1 homolog [Branchiostoma floridae]
MEFSNLLENPMAVIELYGGHVGWILMTCLVATVVTICFYYLVKGFQNRQTQEDVSPQQYDQESLTCPICRSDSCDDDHESTFLFHREQYKEHSDVEHIKLTQNDENRSLTIFEEIEEFKQLKTVTIIGIELDDSSLTNLFQCVSIHSLQLSKCQLDSVPQSLENLKDLEVLDLSHNNLSTIQAVPMESQPCLKSFNVSHNNILGLRDVTNFRSVKNFNVSYNSIEEIPYEILEMENLEAFSCNHNKTVRWLEPSAGKKKVSAFSLVFLDLSNNLLQEVPKCLKELGNLSEVNLSHNKIGANMSKRMISLQLAELFYLPCLSTLLLMNNNIKSLPVLEMARVSPSMEYIDISNNKLSNVAEALLLLRSLKALLLSHNKIKKLPVDLDLNDLSPTLCVVDLSHNKLEDLPLALCFLRSLKKLYLKQNNIRTISENVKSCKSLAILDVSHNWLREIPSHVISLPNLVEIRASHNHINSVSSLQKNEVNVIEMIALAENHFTHFPEALIQMDKIKKVDLTNNEIKVIPQSIMGMPKDVKLNLQGNPIIDPPLQVCQAGLSAIQAFYEDLTTASSITQCLKTLFLGTYEAGKTSLVRVFQQNRSCLTKPEERTHGIEIAELNLSAPNTSDITLSVWDFAGQETYYMTHQFFLSSKALVLLIVNLEKYDSNSFSHTCGDWMENMIAKVGNPVVIPVATHIDKLSTAEVERRCDDLCRKLEGKERMRIQILEKQLERILKETGEAARDREKQIKILLQKRPSIHPKPVPVSSAKSLDGIQYLKQVILNYAVNKELFPEVGRPIPKAWADTEACVEKRGNELSIPYMTWDDFTALLNKNVPNLQPKSRIKTVAQYLHDTGKILWYSEIESLRNHVFLKPASLVDIFRKVIRHDLETFLDYGADTCYREAEISSAEFRTMKNDLVRKGILHTKLLRCLWSDVERGCRSGTFDDIFHVLIELMRQFDLCYDLDEKEQVVDPYGAQERLPLPWRVKRVSDSKTRTRHHISDRLLLPWHIKDNLEYMTKKVWSSGNTPIISLQYQFPSFIPPGLFARLTVRAHRPEHKLHFVAHWSTGTLCKHTRSRILVLLRFEDAEGLVVSLSARPENLPHGMTGAIFLWMTLKEISAEMEDLLKQWPGVRYDRVTVCPVCHRPSFPGNWLHPSSRWPEEDEVICSLCDNRVPVEFLVPSPPGRRFADYSYEPLSDQQLLRVAGKLDKDWESVAILMDFTRAAVDEFKYNNPYNARQQKFAMLTAWRDQLGRRATRRRLQSILQDAGVDYDVISCLDQVERPFEWEYGAHGGVVDFV